MVHWSAMTQMTHLYFVRHGEYEMNIRQDLVSGRSNHVSLTEKRIRQAKAFGQWLADSSIKPDAVYFSPAMRAIQTMNYSLESADLDMECVVDFRLQELCQGIKEGTSRTEAYNADTLARIAEEQFDFKFPEGESIADTMCRMLDFTTEVTSVHPRHTVFVYGHGFAIRALAGAINSLSHDEIVRGIKTPNLSISRFDTTPDTQSVVYVGRRVIDEESV